MRFSATSLNHNPCFVFQVGDHHPDLHVWDLYNHHEVSLIIFAILLGMSIPFVKMTVLCASLCRFNRSLCCLMERHCSIDGQPCMSSLRRATAVGNMGDGDNDMVPLKPGAGARVCTCARVHCKQTNPLTPFCFPRGFQTCGNRSDWLSPETFVQTRVWWRVRTPRLGWQMKARTGIPTSSRCQRQAFSSFTTAPLLTRYIPFFVSWTVNHLNIRWPALCRSLSGLWHVMQFSRLRQIKAYNDSESNQWSKNDRKMQFSCINWKK